MSLTSSRPPRAKPGVGKPSNAKRLGRWHIAQLTATGLAVIFACGDPEQLGPWPELESGLDPNPPRECTAVETLPERLSEHPCFDGRVPRPSSSMIPYDVRSALWSDGLRKARFLAIPAAGDIGVTDAGSLELPLGSVVVKEFSWGTRRIETRLLSKVDPGTWRMATYMWNDAGTGAVRISSGADIVLGDQVWSIPPDDQCPVCHTEAAGRTLGLTLAQLNRDFRYPTTGRSANQLATLVNAGVMDHDGLDRPTALPAMAAPDDPSAPIDERARAYLDTNCAHCHRPGGTSGGSLDLRDGAPFGLAGLCNQRPQSADPLDGEGFIVVPGNPERSILVFRLASEDRYWRMSPVGTNQVDPTGVELVSTWIQGLDSCEEQAGTP